MAQIDDDIAEDLGKSLALLEILAYMAGEELFRGTRARPRAAHLEHEKYWTTVRDETQALLDKYQHVRAATL